MKNLTFLTYSLGCRTNQAEITKIAKELTSHGFGPWNKKGVGPDIVLINTCVVTAKAERETRKAIRHFRRVYPNTFLVVLGCGVEAKQRLKINLPKADLFVKNQEKQKAADLIAQHFPLAGTKQPSFKDKYFLSGRALLKIQDGCDRFCSYCIVPFLRREPKSLPPKEIISQIKELENQEIKEVILTGINLALYGKDRQPKTCLTELLEKILKETKIERISLSSVEPDIIDKEFISLFLGNKRLSSHFHLALQSGSPKVLKRMGRRTNLKKLLEFLLFIKQKIPEFTFRADILVGFPGETEKEFEETLAFLKKARISFVHVFPFSKRPGTKAFSLIKRGVYQDLPKGVKKERVERIQKEVSKIRGNEAKTFLGKSFPCLFIQKKDAFWKTITPNSWPVKVFANEERLRGKIKLVKISRAEKGFLIGFYYLDRRL